MKRLLLLTIGLLTLILAGRAGAQSVPPRDPPPPARLEAVVVEATVSDLSLPLAQMDAFLDRAAPPRPDRDRLLPPVLGVEVFAPDPALQRLASAGTMPPPIFNFEGLPNLNGLLPPDTVLDVGPNHLVEMVNLSLGIWTLDRATGTATLAPGFPKANHVLWAGFGGACETTNDGDPMLVYDHMADRWLASQFALPNYPSGPFYECVAVSQTGDPTGAWYRYAFPWRDGSVDYMNDYPKFGVWPDGYYLSVNQYSQGSSWRGAGVAVLERSAMLLGQPAKLVYFNLYPINSEFGNLLPSDLDGPPPPAGTPNTFAAADDASVLGPEDAIRLWNFSIDWANPSAATFGLNGQPNQVIPTAPFSLLCPGNTNCLPQPGTTQGLDAIADRLLHRLQYRNFGSYATLVSNQTVGLSTRQAAVRWYELRQATDTWAIHQQGTYAGEGSNLESRWMGSAAMDRVGNLAVGYSVTGSETFPSVRYAGRLAGDPLGVLGQGEAEIIAGSGIQTSSSGRWGDYSALVVDPVDDCTFWYGQEYYAVSGERSWRTRIAAFTFPSCLAGPTGELAGIVRDATSAAPLAGALVSAGGLTTPSGPDGSYHLVGVATGAQEVTAARYGYFPSEAVTATIVTNAVTPLDLVLTARPTVTLIGTVRDGSGQGWPLYARILVRAVGYNDLIFTDPATGAYTLPLAVGVTHTLTVSAVDAGYLSETRPLTPTLGAPPEDFALLVGPTAPCPLGYLEAAGACAAQTGGLLVGQVSDANTLQGINGATVASVSAPGEVATSGSTPEDPALDEGFYRLFTTQLGSQDFRASAPSYPAVTQTVTVAPGALLPLDFALGAPLLALDPQAVTVTLLAREGISQTVTLTNVGGETTVFTVTEVNAPAPDGPTGPFAVPTRRGSPKRVSDLDAKALAALVPPDAPGLPAPAEVGRWTPAVQLPRLWGLGWDAARGRLLLGSVDGDGGVAVDAYDDQGSVLGAGERWQLSGGLFLADLTYDPDRDRFWGVDVGAGNCLTALDPVSLRRTGARICPPLDNSQRGLTYNPNDHTFYSGAWMDGIIQHFDGRGQMLDSSAVGLNIAGLAYAPASRRLYVSANAAVGYDVYILAPDDGYRILGGFDVAGMEAYQQAGLTLDCAGRLWLANQGTGEVFALASGEAATCAAADIPWLEVTPWQGTLAAGETVTLTLRFDAGLAGIGTHLAHAAIRNDGPYGLALLPLALDVQPRRTFFPYFPVTTTLKPLPTATPPRP